MSGERGVAQAESRTGKERISIHQQMPFGHRGCGNDIQSGKLLMFRIDVKNLPLP
jgi:hypothetical protein